MKQQHYVSNPDSIISGETEAQLNAQMKMLDQQGTAQVAIVLLQTIGDKVPKDIAHEIFKLWQPGSKEKNNGLVVLLVEDQHRIEFETGYGLEGDLPDVICFRIQQEKMLPYFKQNDYDNGMLAGMESVIAVLNHTEVAEEVPQITVEQPFTQEIDYGEPPKSNVILGFLESHGPFIYIFYIVFTAILATLFKPKKHKAAFNEIPALYTPGALSRMWLYLMPGIVMLLLSWRTELNYEWWMAPALFYAVWLTHILYSVIIVNINAVRLLSNEPVKRYNGFKQAHQYLTVQTILFPFPLLAYYFFNKWRLNRIRSTPRNCAKCQNTMTLAKNKNRKKHLDQGQLLEEKMKSVSYDVWICQNDNSIELAGYHNVNDYIVKCPECHYRTFKTGARRTVTPATRSSTGKGVQHYICKNCNHEYKEYYVIEKLSSSSSSSSSGSSFGSSSSSSSSSWGGGRSGGGGSGSSW